MGENIGKVGVLIGLESDTTDKEGLAKLGMSLAMHVAAGKPLYNTVQDIPQADLDKEKTIYLQQAQESGKTKDIAEKMTTGRIKKWHVRVVSLDVPLFVCVCVCAGACKCMSVVLEYIALMCVTTSYVCIYIHVCTHT